MTKDSVLDCFITLIDICFFTLLILGLLQMILFLIQSLIKEHTGESRRQSQLVKFRLKRMQARKLIRD